MSTLARNLIDRLFVKILHRNPDNNDVDDVEALAYLNEATREVHRWYALYLPDFVSKMYSYDVVAGESSVVLQEPFTSIKSVTIDGRGVLRSNPMVPERSYRNEQLYTTMGFDTISFSMTFKKPQKVVIVYLPAEIPTLRIPTLQEPLQPGETDRSIFPAVWDDSLIEHAMISYEAARGMMQDSETSMRSKWMQQVMTLYFDNNQPTSVGEYYMGYAPRGDML